MNVNDQLQRELRAYKAYLLRLPVLTRSVATLCIAVYVLDCLGFGLKAWMDLDPSKINMSTMYRLNTYPLPHLSLLHLLPNLLALLPLLTRHERSHGSLLTLLQILGPLTTFPAFLYLAISYILRTSTPVVGASAWVFTLISAEAVETWRVRPTVDLLGRKIPTWATPLGMCLLIAVLMPGTSFVGHLCGIVVGYLMGLGWLNILNTPEWILRKVEDKLPLEAFIPHYVGLEGREKAGMGFVLPSHNGGDVELGGVGEGEASAFRGTGRPLGA
ncbi:rhomboid-domain-containing protein [Ascobolus immersus RN42]|uniref:rhomboid protease n=1 Tax=Ascobolus immersus RN42 TaxID=1160509 RepID=A0A3N4HSX4_ASCIM|nr:rhomboid-domain-containing protein [Ascobolus immersus RN42]